MNVDSLSQNGMSQNGTFQGGMAQGGMGGDDPMPTSPDPLSPSRTDLNPSDTPGVDELPNNEGEIPLDSDDDAPIQEEMADVDVDNAEFDDQPNPR